MPRPSESDLLVLLALRLKGFADTAAVAELSGLREHEAAERLDRFEGEGLTKHRAGKISGWVLTAAGRDQGERLLAEELDAADARDDVTAAYERFLLLNPAMLQVCTDWQMREVDGSHVVNDHTDTVYDGGVVERLARIDADAEQVCNDLADLLGRFAGYAKRLRHALHLVQAGETEWFTKPTIDSYHTVWFELHENLLATLGIERGKEVARE
jgi:hypothetical protein